MNRHKRCLCKFICMCLFFASLCSGCSFGGREITLDLGIGANTVFEIGGACLHEPEARVYLANLKNLYGVIDGQTLWTDNGNAVLEKAVKNIALENLKRVYILDTYAKELGLTLTDDEKKICSSAAADYYSSLSPADRKYLKTNKKKLTAIYERYLLAQRTYESLMASADTDISEDECRVIRANVIFVSDSQTAQTIDNAIKNKEQTFQLLASTYSEAPSYEVHVTRGMYSADVENVIFSLKDGQISDPVYADGGYYFFRCIEKYDEELSSEHAKELIQARKSDALQGAYTYVMQNYKNIIYGSEWEKVEVDYDPEITTYNFFLTLSEKLI